MKIFTVEDRIKKTFRRFESMEELNHDLNLPEDPALNDLNGQKTLVEKEIAKFTAAELVPFIKKTVEETVKKVLKVAPKERRFQFKVKASMSAVICLTLLFVEAGLWLSFALSGYPESMIVAFKDVQSIILSPLMIAIGYYMKETRKEHEITQERIQEAKSNIPRAESITEAERQ